MKYNAIADRLDEREREFLDSLDCQIEEGDIYAKEKWATFFAYDRPELTTEDVIEKIILYYEEAVEKGISRAMLNLGAIYYNGVIVKQNFEKAVELYKMAAESTDDNIAPKAICNLGYCYYYGRSVAVDKTKAFSYWLKGTLKYNDSNSTYKLGDMYMYGDCVEQDLKMAYMLYVSAMLNSCDRQSCIADVYMRIGKCKLYGLGTKRDVVSAIEDLTKAKAFLYNKIYIMQDPFAHGTMAKVDNLIAEAKSVLKEGEQYDDGEPGSLC